MSSKTSGLHDISPAAADYRALFDNALIPMALITAKGPPRIVAVSRGFLEAVQMRRNAVVGRSLSELLAPSARSKVSAAIQRCLMSSQSVRAQAELLAGRRLLRMSLHAANTRGFSGHVVLEVTGARQALLTGTETTALPARPGDEQGRSFTYVHDLRTERIRFVDEGLARALGLPADGVMMLPTLTGLIHPDDRRNLPTYERLRDRLEDDDFVGATVRLRDSEGDWRLVNVRARVLRRDRAGMPRAMLGSVTDISEYAAAAVEAAGLLVRGAEEDERARIGRELHDSTSQFLVAAELGVLQLLKSAELTDEVREKLTGVQASLAATQAEMRAFAFFLHPPELTELGLRRTLERFCAGFARRSGLTISVACSGGCDELEPETEHALFRVCQEALMNVHRHAYARSATVTLDASGDDLRLEVRDDGVGVEQAERFDTGGIGVAGMRARMRSIGGSLELNVTGPGVGVIAHAPHRLARTSVQRGPILVRRVSGGDSPARPGGLRRTGLWGGSS